MDEKGESENDSITDENNEYTIGLRASDNNDDIERKTTLLLQEEWAPVLKATVEEYNSPISTLKRFALSTNMKVVLVGSVAVLIALVIFKPSFVLHPITAKIDHIRVALITLFCFAGLYYIARETPNKTPKKTKPSSQGGSSRGKKNR